MSCVERHAIRAQISHAIRTATWHCDLNVDIWIHSRAPLEKRLRDPSARGNGLPAPFSPEAILAAASRFPSMPRKRTVGCESAGKPPLRSTTGKLAAGPKWGPPGLHTEITTIRVCAAGHRDISLSVSPTRIDHQPTNHP